MTLVKLLDNNAQLFIFISKLKQFSIGTIHLSCHANKPEEWLLGKCKPLKMIFEYCAKSYVVCFESNVAQLVERQTNLGIQSSNPARDELDEELIYCLAPLDLRSDGL